MRRFGTVFLMFAVVGGLVYGGGAAEMSEAAALEEIMALELGTYETYYGASDPTAYTELFADKVTYFDPWQDKYTEDGAVKESIMAFKGKIPILDYQIVNPRLDLYGDTAIFVFNLEYSDPASGKVLGVWKGTTIFTRAKGSWEKVHAHWSASSPAPE